MTYGLRIAALATFAVSAHAAMITVTSYSGPNGGLGSFSYYDQTYNGSGNTGLAYAALSGGTGDLTDGVVQTTHWQNPPADGGVPNNLPWVAWLQNSFTFDSTFFQGLDGTPLTIRFFFPAAYNITRARIHIDDTDDYGAVNAPASASLFDGTSTVNTAITNPSAASSPLWIELNFAGLSGSFLDLTLTFRSPDPQWIFLDEVEFEGDPADTPEPGTFALIGAGLIGIAVLRRRRSAN